jgi:uncharacterized protein YjbI with pentapeptide repeats
MKIYKPNQLSLMLKPMGIKGTLYMAATVFLYFDLNDPHQPLSEQDLWGAIPDQLGPGGVLDMGMPKPHAEVLVTGACHPSGREPVAESSVAVKVGAVEKNLAVFGDRYWSYIEDMVVGCTNPRPFTQMPIAFNNAFGGEGFERNPTGKGIAPVAMESGETVHPLPNIEYPANLIQSPKDRPAPAGFGVLDFMWPQRYDKQGTYDKKWKKNRFPYYPDDMDYEFFNCAPEDQYFHGFFEGGETIEIANMHPNIPMIRSELPRLRVRCFVTQKEHLDSDEEVFREVTTNIDTVRLFPEILRGVVIYRGETEILDDEFDDVVRVFLATEKLSEEPRSAEHYLQAQYKTADLSISVDMAPIKAASKKIGNALKRVKALPKEIQMVKQQAMGKTPVMPAPTPGEMQALGDKILQGNMAVLDRLEAQAREMQAKWGHLAKIPLEKFDLIRARMAAAEKGLGKARDKIEQAQKSGQKLKQSMGDQLKRKIPPEYLEKTGINPDNLLAPPPVNPWHDTGFPFVAASRRRLTADPAALERLKELGLERRTIRRHWLGINPEALDTAAEDWGLDPVLDASGNAVPLTLPAGLVLPRFDEAVLNRILIRTATEDKWDQDVLVDGSDETPLFLPAATLIDLPAMPAAENAPCVVAADELQALLVEQEVGDACSVTALPAADVSLGDDAAEAAMAAPVLLVLAAVGSDLDSLSRAWQAAYENAVVYPFPEGDTVFEARTRGIDIRAFIMDALPQDYARAHQVEPILPAPGKPPEGSPLEGLTLPKLDIKGLVNGLISELREFHQPKKEALQAQKKAMEDKAIDSLRKVGLDPEKALAQAQPTEHKSFTEIGRSMAARITEKQGQLRKSGMLTPELEQQMRKTAQNTARLGENAEAQYQRGMSKLAGAKDKFADLKTGKFPSNMQPSFNVFGLGPEQIKRRTRDEVVAMHERGGSLAGAVLSGEDLSGLDLAGIDLSHAQCRETDFSNTRLDGALLRQTLAQKADFSGASLKGVRSEKGIFSQAVFKGARMSESDFHMCVLKEADLEEADCGGTRFSMSILQRALLKKADFSGATADMSVFSGANAASAIFKSARLTKCLFQKTTLDGADFTQAVIFNTIFFGASGKAVVFRKADMRKARMGNGAAFPGADFSDAIMAQACFRETDLQGAIFEGGKLDMAILEKCNLQGSVFRRATATRARFTKSDLTAADMRGINLFQGSLRKANLTRTDLSGANLFAVEFYKTMYSETRMADANLKRTDLGSIRESGPDRAAVESRQPEE